MQSATLLLAQGVLWHADFVDPNKDNPNGPEFGKASPIGLVLILLLLIGTFLLIRSMNRHLRKLPDKFERDNPEADQDADDGTDRRLSQPTGDHLEEQAPSGGAAPPHTPAG
ncbi:hypothetical protein [Speluncibacter jeojiensis]|uniref:Uncharacterized protein n=1 Tax=Speluncibacter jeojiensis TaxID=2710754 RepID=A0A9X4M574_9ACTN|nr:hypothetical protein [Corynebacteriales bacterium D3-21]